MADLSEKQEIALLRSAVAGLIGRDAEGAYRPEFVREMYASLERTPDAQFRSEDDFLADVAAA